MLGHGGFDKMAVVLGVISKCKYQSDYSVWCLRQHNCNYNDLAISQIAITLSNVDQDLWPYGDTRDHWHSKG